MAKKKRPTARAAAAAVDSNASKKQKPEVHSASLKVIWPPNVSPQTAKLSASGEARREARQAKQGATSEEAYGPHDYAKFAEPFEAAVAAAFAKTGEPVTLTAIINKMTKMTKCTPKICKTYKCGFAWDGFNEGRWQISRRVPPQGQVPFPKGSPRDKDGNAGTWRFSPSPAARPAGGPV